MASNKLPPIQSTDPHIALLQEILGAREILQQVSQPTYRIHQRAPKKPKRPIPAAEYQSAKSYAPARGPGSLTDASNAAQKIAQISRRARLEQAHAASNGVVVLTNRFSGAPARHLGISTSYEAIAFSDARNVGSLLVRYTYSFLNVQVHVPNQAADFATAQQVSLHVNEDGRSNYSVLRIINGETFMAASLDSDRAGRQLPHFDYGVDFRPSDAIPERTELALTSVRRIINAATMPQFSPAMLDSLAV